MEPLIPDSPKVDIDIIKEYVDGAKSFVQFSSAGLVIPILLSEKLAVFKRLAARSDTPEFVAVCLSWLFLLVAIGAGVFYQYVAIKFVEYHRYPSRTYLGFFVKPIVKVYGPGYIYGVMVVAFYCGAICVVLYSIASII